MSDNLTERQKDVRFFTLYRTGEGVNNLVGAEVENVQVVFSFESKHHLRACQESNRFYDLILETLSLHHNVIVLFMNFDHGESFVSADHVELLVRSFSDGIDMTLVFLVFDLRLADDRVLRVVHDCQVASLLPAKQELRADHLNAGQVKEI